MRLSRSITEEEANWLYIWDPGVLAEHPELRVELFDRFHENPLLWDIPRDPCPFEDPKETTKKSTKKKPAKAPCKG